ncbi:MAG: hypothetical protein ACE5GD_04350 [Candidatus Geothermarchaeales archaeon]
MSADVQNLEIRPQGQPEEILIRINYKRIIPTSKGVEDAIHSIKKIYPVEREFLAFELE